MPVVVTEAALLVFAPSVVPRSVKVMVQAWPAFTPKVDAPMEVEAFAVPVSVGARQPALVVATGGFAVSRPAGSVSVKASAARFTALVPVLSTVNARVVGLADAERRRPEGLGDRGQRLHDQRGVHARGDDVGRAADVARVGVGVVARNVGGHVHADLAARHAGVDRRAGDGDRAGAGGDEHRGRSERAARRAIGLHVRRAGDAHVGGERVGEVDARLRRIGWPLLASVKISVEVAPWSIGVGEKGLG